MSTMETHRDRRRQTHPPKKHTILSPLSLGIDKRNRLALQNTRRDKKMGGKSRINLHPHLSPAPPGKSRGWRECEGGRKDGKGRETSGSQVLYTIGSITLHRSPARSLATLPKPSPPHHPKPRGAQPSEPWVGSPALTLLRPDQGLEAGVSPTRQLGGSEERPGDLSSDHTREWYSGGRGLREPLFPFAQAWESARGRGRRSRRVT